MDIGGENSTRKCHVVAVPYPGRGHMNPMMSLSKQLSSKGLLITLVVTEEWLGLLGSAPPLAHPNIRIRTIPNVIPSEHVRGADLGGFYEAVCTKMEDPLDRLLDRLEPPVSYIVADTYLPWAIAVGERRNMPVASLYPMSPWMFAFHHNFHLVVSNGHFPIDDFSEKGQETIDYVPGMKSIRLEELQPFLQNNRLRTKVLETFLCPSKAQCLILTSFYELESRLTDTLRGQLPFPVYTVGPCIPYMSLCDDYVIPADINGSVDCYDWLNSQPLNSVLYVSLGSFLSVSDAQMDEIAVGLHDSKVRFLWVVRGNVSRMQKLSGEMGIVVPWCHQLRVLCHPSVGGFLTHCGFNSTMEGIYAGVPMLTLPIVWDQFRNSGLIVDDWEVGLRLKAKGMFGVETVVRREEVALIVKRLMELERDESKELRRRAKQLKEICRRALDDGGSSFTNLEAFVSEVVCRGE